MQDMRRHASLGLRIGVTVSDSKSHHPSHIPEWTAECFPALWESEEEQGGKENDYANKIMWGYGVASSTC